MKTKIVIWGTNEKDEKILLGIELVESENKVKIYVFPESEAKEDFYNLMINDWRVGNPVVFPDNHSVIERALSVTESLLPDNIKVTRTDVVNRAKAEWHFVVLSAKLFDLYQGELSDIKEKVNNLEVFDKNVWEELKSFWQKVQGQLYDKNLFREHAKELQDETNLLFDKMKAYRKKFDEKFKEESKEKAAAFHEKLEEIRKKFSEGFGLQPLWNEMKSLQSKFRDQRMAKQDRNEIWNKIDALFKDIKEKKYGGKGEGGKNNALERIENRYNGLLAAIKKMENSIKWDKKDMKFQSTKAEGSFGQLEQELRGAKMKMIEERVLSKEAKLSEMFKTKEMLEGKIEKEKEKQKKIEEAQKIKEKEEELKAKVKEEIKEKNKILEEKMGIPLAETQDNSEAAQEDSEIAEEEASVQVDEEDERSIGEKIQDVAEDVVISVRAAGQVIGDRVSKAVDSITEEE
jgi:hypothetical protein